MQLTKLSQPCNLPLSLLAIVVLYCSDAVCSPYAERQASLGQTVLIHSKHSQALLLRCQCCCVSDCFVSVSEFDSVGLACSLC